MQAVLARRFTDYALWLCLGAMDGAWVYLAAWLASTYVLVRISALPVPSAATLALVEFAAIAFSSWLFKGGRVKESLAQTLGSVGALALAFAGAAIANPPTGGVSLQWLGESSLAFAVSLALAFTGSYRASQGVNFNQAYGSFRFGVVSIGICAGITAVLAREQSEQAWAGVGGVAVWFFAWGLAALALGNRNLLRREIGSTGSGPWSAELAVTLGAIVLIGISTGVFGGTASFGIVGQAVQWVFLAVGTAIYFVMYVVVKAIALLTPSRSSTPPTQPTPIPEDGTCFGCVPRNAPVEFQAPQVDVVIPPIVWTISLWLGALLLLLAVALIMRAVLRRTRAGSLHEVDEERESLGAWRLLMQQLREWLNGLLGRFRPAPAPTVAVAQDDLAGLQGNPEWSGTLSVRQMYARLQTMAAAVGHGRAAGQTPLEYAPVLEEAFPGYGPEVEAITAAYIEARYSRYPAPGTAVLAAQHAWKRLEPALKQRLPASAAAHRAPVIPSG